MKIRILEPCLVNGKCQKPGTVVELNEHSAWNIISLGRGEEFKAPAAAAQAQPGAGDQEREPNPETREGGKAGRGKA